MKLKGEAQQSVDQASAALAESNLRIEMLREQLEAMRLLLTSGDTELAQARADLASALHQIASLEENVSQAQSAA